MGTKIRPGNYDCYHKLLPDEPFFVLAARDPSAPSLVHEWANEREQDVESGASPPSDRLLVAEARDCATAMQTWRALHLGEWRQDPSKDAGLAGLLAALRRLFSLDGRELPDVIPAAERERFIKDPASFMLRATPTLQREIYDAITRRG